MPRRPSSCISAGNSTLPAALGNTTISAPCSFNFAAFASSITAHAINTPPPSKMRAVSGNSSRLSITTRSGWRGVVTARTVNCGSSSRTVPMPVKTAHARARQ
jgi:hypothetical protein